MKTCTRCEQEKNEDQFGFRKEKDRDVSKYRESWCKQCKKEYVAEYNKEWYKRNREAVLNKQKEVRERNLNYVCDYLVQHPCSDCGETDIVVLEFDHINGKKKGIARLMPSASLAQIQEEIERCEVVCRNCHIRRESKRGNWFRLAYGVS